MYLSLVHFNLLSPRAGNLEIILIPSFNSFIREKERDRQTDRQDTYIHTYIKTILAVAQWVKDLAALL